MSMFESEEGLSYLLADLDNKTKEIRMRDVLVCKLIDEYFEKYEISTEEFKLLAKKIVISSYKTMLMLDGDAYTAKH